MSVWFTLTSRQLPGYLKCIMCEYTQPCNAELGLRLGLVGVLGFSVSVKISVRGHYINKTAHR